MSKYLPGTRKPTVFKRLLQLDDSNYMKNGWKSSFPSIKKWLFGVPGMYFSVGLQQKDAWEPAFLLRSIQNLEGQYLEIASFPAKRYGPVWGKKNHKR